MKFLLTLFSAVVMLCGAAFAADALAKPNIIVIFADEVRWCDLLAAPERKHIPTPNLDRLAAEGMRFTQAYVSSPWCSPSRAGLLTGRYPQRFGHEFNPNQPGAKPTWGLNLKERTMADALKSSGYATAMYGKWHQGLADEMTPNARGFDEWFGFREGEHDYLRSADKDLGPVEHNGRAIEFTGYLTEFLAEKAAVFIRAKREQPFFIYAPFNEIHRPYQAPEKYRALVANAPLPEGVKLIAANLCALDAAVGAILNAVHEAQLDERTLIVFTSDNGRPHDEHIMPWDTLRGGREQMWEGGVRVPFLARWKGTIAASSQYAHP
ncbi:MAG: sulfatase-like hydrolase/transferase, partial [Verrucomicrobia bacterium]|nr:sulfatase-like hydrolase/transferase [Verrucomicrobiota bacterium]